MKYMLIISTALLFASCGGENEFKEQLQKELKIEKEMATEEDMKRIDKLSEEFEEILNIDDMPTEMPSFEDE